MASQILIRPEPFTCYTSLAPEPRDMYVVVNDLTFFNMKIEIRIKINIYVYIV